MLSTCVSPRWKSPEPWVRFTVPTSTVSGRMSAGERPSRRMPFLTTLSRIVDLRTCLKAFFASDAASGSSPATAATVSSRSFLSASERWRLSAILTRSESPGPAAFSICPTTSGERSGADGQSTVGISTSAANSNWRSMLCEITVLAFASPSTTAASSLGASPSATRRTPPGVAPASTIITSISPSELRRPATVISNTPSAISWWVGKATHSPLMRARRAAPMGPWRGMGLTVRAAEAPIRARTSKGFSPSMERGIATTWVSQRKLSEKDGRSARSISLQPRIAPSLGLPSRRKKDPGMRPAAYMRSSKSTVSGKKSIPSRNS